MSGMKKCPACGVSVKTANLEAHVQRVHPGQDVRLQLSPEERAAGRVSRKSTSLGRSTARRAAVVAIALLILAAVAWAVYGPALSPSRYENGRIGVEPASWDFGDIPRSVATHRFTVRSVGADPLRITGISTSCSCTSAVLYANGRQSPTFGMHGNPTGWSETLAPGQTADLTVQYDPNVHPDTGLVLRVIYIRSDDRTVPEVEVSITANVVP